MFGLINTYNTQKRIGDVIYISSKHIVSISKEHNKDFEMNIKSTVCENSAKNNPRNYGV